MFEEDDDGLLTLDAATVEMTMDMKLTAEFGKSALRYVSLYSQNHLRRAFEIIDDVEGAREGLENAAANGQLDKQAAKAGKTVSEYVNAQVQKVIDNAHAKADVMFSYIYNSHTSRDSESTHRGSA